jgi:hypothetical protein
MIWIVLLIVHGLLALTLLGAITHQAVSISWPRPRKRSFVERFAAVASPAYVNAIVALFAVTFVFGSLIYVNYRTEVRPVFESLGWHASIGLFELKEHFLALSLALLPTYWFIWKKLPLTQQGVLRRTVTVMLAVLVWYGFLAGHILNNLRGLGA